MGDTILAMILSFISYQIGELKYYNFEKYLTIIGL